MSLYFDFAATTPVREEVLETMTYVLANEYGNSSSLHNYGQAANDRLKRARKQVAGAINATPREIIFTGSATEANNLAIFGTAARRREAGKHIIVSQIEHPSVLYACEQLERDGFHITVLPVDTYGRVCLTDVKNALRDETILVSIMAANNEVGTLQPIQKIAELLQDHTAWFHTDAVQYFGKCPLNIRNVHVDFLSLGAHKIYGPKGVGALYIRKGRRLSPIVFGGGQERGYRPSTENIAGIAGFGVAAELANQELAGESTRLSKLRDTLWTRLKEDIGDVVLNGHPTERLPNNLNVSFNRIEGQAIMLELNRKGIAISSGSACSTNKHEPSQVILAMGKSRDEAIQSIRITLGKYTTEQHIDTLVHELKSAVTYLRSLMLG